MFMIDMDLIENVQRYMYACENVTLLIHITKLKIRGVTEDNLKIIFLISQ